MCQRRLKAEGCRLLGKKILSLQANSLQANRLYRGKKGWIPPSIQQKKDSVVRIVEDLKPIVNITKVVVEQGQFDTSSMSAEKKKEGTEYQIPDYEGRDFREKVLWRERKKIWEANPTKTCTEKNGFKHWDLVKAKHRTRGTVIGVVRSMKATTITLRTPWDDNFPVSYRKSKVLWRFSGIAYV